MTTQQFLKGILMALVGVLVTFFTQTPVNYLLMALTAVCSIFVYTGKNLILVLHSNSPVGSLSFINIVSALLLAIGNGVLGYASMIIAAGVVDWSVLGKVTGSIVLTYVITTWFAPAYSPVKKRLFV